MNQISKYSIQVLCFTVAMLIVALVSSYITAGSKDKEQKKVLKEYRLMLQKQEEYAQKKIEQLHIEIDELEKLKRIDSIRIVGFQHKIQQSEIKMEKERKEASKMTIDEQKNWLVNRYNKSN